MELDAKTTILRSVEHERTCDKEVDERSIWWYTRESSRCWWTTLATRRGLCERRAEPGTKLHLDRAKSCPRSPASEKHGYSGRDCGCVVAYEMFHFEKQRIRNNLLIYISVIPTQHARIIRPPFFVGVCTGKCGNPIPISNDALRVFEYSASLFIVSNPRAFNSYASSTTRRSMPLLYVRPDQPPIGIGAALLPAPVSHESVNAI